jgi:hypothetical protein
LSKPSSPKILADCGIVEASDGTINPNSARIFFASSEYKSPDRKTELKFLGKVLGLNPISIWNLYNRTGIDALIYNVDDFGSDAFKNIWFQADNIYYLEKQH